MRPRSTWLLFTTLAGLVAVALQYTIGIPTAEKPAACGIKPTELVITDLDLFTQEDDPELIRDVVYQYLPLDCKRDVTPDLSDYTCRAYITSFNGVGARHIMFFFLHGELNLVRVWYPPASQPTMLDMLRKQYGAEEDFETTLGPGEPHTVGWVRPKGMVIIHDRVVGKEKYEAFLWLSPSQVQRLPYQTAQRQ